MHINRYMAAAKINTNVYRKKKKISITILFEYKKKKNRLLLVFDTSIVHFSPFKYFRSEPTRPQPIPGAIPLELRGRRRGVVRPCARRRRFRFRRGRQRVAHPFAGPVGHPTRLNGSRGSLPMHVPSTPP
jgi:hypothetical protein